MAAKHEPSFLYTYIGQALPESHAQIRRSADNSRLAEHESSSLYIDHWISLDAHDQIRRTTAGWLAGRATSSLTYGYNSCVCSLIYLGTDIDSICPFLCIYAYLVCMVAGMNSLLQVFSTSSMHQLFTRLIIKTAQVRCIQISFHACECLS